MCVRLHLHRIAPFPRFLICSIRRLARFWTLRGTINLAAPHCVASLRVRLHFHRIAPFFRILFVTAVPSNIASAMPKPAHDSGWETPACYALTGNEIARMAFHNCSCGLHGPPCDLTLRFSDLTFLLGTPPLRIGGSIAAPCGLDRELGLDAPSGARRHIKGMHSLTATVGGRTFLVP